VRRLGRAAVGRDFLRGGGVEASQRDSRECALPRDRGGG
jgi:hypothetical protein